MKRTRVNPWAWSLEFGFSQGQMIEGGRRTLYRLDGQTLPREGVARL